MIINNAATQRHTLSLTRAAAALYTDVFVYVHKCVRSRNTLFDCANMKYLFGTQNALVRPPKQCLGIHARDHQPNAELAKRVEPPQPMHGGSYSKGYWCARSETARETGATTYCSHARWNMELGSDEPTYTLCVYLHFVHTSHHISASIALPIQPPSAAT